MNKFLAIAVLLGFAVSAIAAEPGITVEARQRYPWNGLVDIKFTITGTSGTKYDTSFTAKDVVGGTNLTMKTLRKSNGVAANVEKEQLQPGTYNWVWDAAVDLPKDFKCDRVTVSGVAKEFNPLYMVIDLAGGPNATSYPISYLDAVPSGGWDDAHRGNFLVLRKVTKGSNSIAGSMSSDMWVGVFEVTQLQYRNIKGTNPSTHSGDFRPVEHAGYFAFQDLLTRLSNKTGFTFRFPTRSEWRYACRAGSTVRVFSATAVTARYPSTANDGKGGYNTYHTQVGSYNPNDWGLYDMLGNVGEWTSTGMYGDSRHYFAYSLGGYANCTIYTGNPPSSFSGTPTDETEVARGTDYGGDDAEGLRVFGLVK